MFGLGPATRIYLAVGATDLRKGFEGLYGLVRDRMLGDPLSGHVFVFSNAQRNRLKLLFGMAAGCGCARNDWRRGASGGRRLRASREGGAQPGRVGVAGGRDRSFTDTTQTMVSDSNSGRE